MRQISPLSKTNHKELQAQMDSKLKPVGSLGQLEPLAIQLAMISEQPLSKAELFLFAADHGIAEQGVSVAPQGVTTLMVHQFLQGRAAINSLCEVNQVALHVIDAGLVAPIEETWCINSRIGTGTKDFSNQPAMTEVQALQALDAGAQLVQQQIEKECDCVLLGEMGIGNTSSASAIMAALTDYTVAECVGAGTGIDTETLSRKQALIEKALERLTENATPLKVLVEVGGFEIAQMVGAILGAAEKGTPVIIDGFICSAAALLAVRMAPECVDYLIFSHLSNEQAHAKLLAEMNGNPLLDLGLRLGEGSGAVLAMPLIRSAQECFNNMGSLADVGLA